MRQAAFVFLLLVLLFPARAGGQQNQTLGDVLAQNSISSSSLSSVSHLNDPITSYTTLNTDREFLIAYYLAAPQNELRFPLLLTRLDKRSGKWQEASLTDMKVQLGKGTRQQAQDDCIGSAVDLESNDNWYYLDLHWDPSAGCLVILNHDLTVRQTLTGWTAAIFKSGLLVYEGNTVHFAAVHPLMLFLYDPASRKSQEIYPQKDDPFRKDFSERLKKVIDDKRCRENDWSCAPNEFESSVSQPIEVNDETHSLAFRVDFDTVGFLPREEAEGSGKWDDDQYVYIYQLNPFRWREFSVYDLKPKFGTDSLKDLLAPEKLSQVFATPPSR